MQVLTPAAFSGLLFLLEIMYNKNVIFCVSRSIPLQKSGACMLAITILTQLVSMFLIMLIAYLLTKLGKLDSHIIGAFSYLMTTVLLPAMVINSLQVPFSFKLLAGFGTCLLSMALMILVGIAFTLPVCLARRIPIKESGALMACVCFSNAIFIGRPIILALYGDTAQSTLAGIIFSFNLLFYLVGVLMLSLRENRGNSGFLKALQRALCNPTLIACIVGLLLFVLSVRLPFPVTNTLDMLGSMVTPLSMIILGHALAQERLLGVFTDGRVYLATFLRLIACPIAVHFVLRLFIKDPVMLGIQLFVAATPTGAMVGMVSTAHDNNPLLCSRVILMSTMLCILTIPTISLLLLN